MKIEEQVLSREQMAHLVELGVDTSDASMCWAGDDVVPNNGLALDLGHDGVPTYTIGDLIEKLPKNIEYYQLKIDWHDKYVRYLDWYFEQVIGCIGDFSFKYRPIIEALYDCLCWVAETYKELIK